MMNFLFRVGFLNNVVGRNLPLTARKSSNGFHINNDENNIKNK